MGILDYAINNALKTATNYAMQQPAPVAAPTTQAASTTYSGSNATPVAAPLPGIGQATAAPTAMPSYFVNNPDVAAAYQQNNYGLTPEQFAQTHYEKYGQAEQRAAPTTAANTASSIIGGPSNILAADAQGTNLGEGALGVGATSGTSTSPAATAPTFQSVLNSIYQNLYGRDADTAGTQYWQNQVRSGAITDVNQLYNTILGGTTGADINALVNKAYSNLGRTQVGTGANNIDQAGLDYWTNQLTSGAVNPLNFRTAFNTAANPNLTAQEDAAYAAALGQNYNPLALQTGLPQGYTTQDIQGALGKYNILNQAGQNVGIGYKSVADTVRDYQTQQMMQYANPVYENVSQYDELGNMRYDLMNWNTGQYDPEKVRAAGYTFQTDPQNPESQRLVRQTGYTFDQPMGSTSGLYANQYGEEGSPQTFSTLEEARNALLSGKVSLRNEAGQSIYMPGMDSKWFTQEHGGDIAKSAADWEALGQILAGGQVASPQEWGALPINQQTEKIAGEQTLYGSKPVFYNGQLIGYEADLGLGGTAGKADNGQARGTEDYHFKQWGPLGYAVGEDTTGHNWASALQRAVDPNAYKGLVTGLGGTQYFAPVENVSKLPGWENKEMYGYQDLKTDDWSLLKNVNNLIRSVDPLGGAVEDSVAKALGFDNGLDMVRSIGEPVGNLVGAVFAGGIPIGSLVMAAEGASLGNEQMALNSLGNAALSYAGGAVNNGISNAISPAVNGALGSYAGTAIGNTTLGAITTQALTSATTAGLMAGAKGGDWGDVGSAMLTSGLTSGVGQLSNAYLQGYLQNSLGMSADTSKLAASSLSKGLTTTLSSLADGAGAEKSFIQGAIAGGTQYIANTLRSGIKDSLPESMQGKITDSALNSLVDAAAKYISGQITGGNTNLKQILDTASNQVAQNIAAGDTTAYSKPTKFTDPKALEQPTPTPAPTPAPTEEPKGGLMQATTPAIVSTPTAGYNKPTQASSGLGPFYLTQGTPGLARGTYNPVSWI